MQTLKKSAYIAICAGIILGIVYVLLPYPVKIDLYGKIAERFGQPLVPIERAAPYACYSDALEDTIDELEDRNSTSIVILKGQKIIAESYRIPYDAGKPVSIAAVAKSIIANPLLALAADAGYIELDARISRYIPELVADEARNRITISQLLNHQAGLDDVRFPSSKEEREAQVGWAKQYFSNPASRFRLSFTGIPMKYEPGKAYSYSGVGYYALAYVLAKQLALNEGISIKDYAASHLMEPLGIPERSWRLSYGRNDEVEGILMHSIGSGAKLSPRGAALLASLYATDGRWRDEQLLPRKEIGQMVLWDQKPGDPDPVSRNHGWFLKVADEVPGLPPRALVGYAGPARMILVVPEMGLTALRFGGPLTEQNNGWEDLKKYFITPVLAAVQSADEICEAR